MRPQPVIIIEFLWRLALVLAALLAPITCNQASASSNEPALSPSQLVKEFDSRCANKSSELEFDMLGLIRRYRPDTFECDRERSSWRWRYLDELGANWREQRARVLIKEGSIDERLANMVYLTDTSKLVYSDAHKFNWGDKQLDEANLQRVAGPQVDDERCGEHLAQMIALIDDLKSRLVQARQRASTGEEEQPSGDGGSSSSSQSVIRVDQMNSSHIQLARVLDSFGRYGAGYLGGQTLAAGSYEQCVGAQLELGAGQAPEQVPTRYCWARFSTRQMAERSLYSSEPIIEQQDTLLHAAICVPHTCHSRSFAKHAQLFQRLASTQFKMPDDIYVTRELPIESVFCLVDPDSQAAKLSSSGHLLIGLAVLWLSLIVYSTWVFSRKSATDDSDDDDDDDVNDDDGATVSTKREEANVDSRAASKKLMHAQMSILQCFDLATCWNEFKRVRHPSKQEALSVNFDTLSLLRVLLCALIIFAHCFVITYGYSEQLLLALRDNERSLHVDVITCGLVAVDVFLMITGMIASYLLSRRARAAMEQRENELAMLGVRESKLKQFARFWQTCLYLNLVRALRLFPLYYLAFWFKKSLWVHLADGPFWDKGLNKDTPVGCCSTASWWSPFLFNYDTEIILKKCVSQGWYIGADLFASMVYTPLIMLNVSRPKLSKSLTVLIMIGFSVMLKKHLELMASPQLLWEVESTRLYGLAFMYNRLTAVFVQPQYHLVFALIGVFSGYALHAYEQRATAAAAATCSHAPSAKAHLQFESHWSRRSRTLIRLLCLPAPFLLLAVYIFNRHLQREFTRPMMIVIGYAELGSVTIFLASCLMAFVLLRLTTDWRNCWVARSMASPFWQLAAKLVFAMYLCNWDVIMLQPMLNSEPSTYTQWRFMQRFAAAYFYTTLLALPVHVLLEVPLSLLTRKLLRR